MPPLVWREKIVLCPNCWEQVSIEDDSCPSCGRLFEPEPEVRERRQAARMERLKDVGNVAALVLVTLSSSLLAISILISALHAWVAPIDQNELPYLLAMALGIIGAIIVFKFNAKLRAMLRTPTRLSRTAPFALLSISFIGIILVLFADQVDRVLSSGSLGVNSLMIASAVSGFALLMLTSGRPKSKRTKNRA